MPNSGECRSGLKIPAPGSVNVAENSAITFLFYLGHVPREEQDLFETCNIWIGGLHVVRNGEVTKGWEMLERILIDDKFIIKIRYRGNLPSAQMFCYGEIGDVKFCDHFFVKGTSTASGVMLRGEKNYTKSVGFDESLRVCRQLKVLDKNQCCIVNGDIFWDGEFFCSLSKSIDTSEVFDKKCHKHGNTIYFFMDTSLLILKRSGAFRWINLEREYKFVLTNKRIDITYEKLSKTAHIYKDKELEPLDRSADLFECDVAESYSHMPDAKLTFVRDAVKIVHNKNCLIVQRDFDPVRSDSDDILWTCKDICSDKNVNSNKYIESVKFADCDKLLVNITGGEKFLVGIYVPDVERI